MTSISVPALAGSRLDLNRIADSDFDQRLLVRISLQVSFAVPEVRSDVDAWVSWMLVGGTRPRANKRATSADGVNTASVNAISVTQSTLCDALQPYYREFDLSNPAHFGLLERATRPLPGTKPLGQPPQAATA